MKHIPFILLGLAIGIMAGWGYAKDPEKIQQLELRIMFLEDYKKAYIDLADRCDTLHERCFRTKEE